MKKGKFQPILFLVASGIVLTGCDGLGKMVKNASQVTYAVTPNPLEMHGDSVQVQISGKYPAKFFNKKAAVEVTPVLMYDGKELSLKSKKFKGESAADAEGTVINYESGGSFNYSDKIAYQPGMEQASLELKAKGSAKGKSKDFPGIKVAEGTIVTPILLMNDSKPTMAKDNFTKTQPRNINGDILFAIQTADVKQNELKEADMQAIFKFIKDGSKSYVYKNISISAYASPDGEERMNEGLSANRGKNTQSALSAEFKKNKLKMDEALFKLSNTPEDWEGFKAAVQSSSIQDKDLILRVLSMYSDPLQREQELKNMSKTFEVLATDILPKLRRSQINIQAEEPSRSDAQIMALVSSNPDSLSAEEMMYAAGMASDNNQKMAIYKKCAEKYNDWRALNNMGYLNILQNNLDAAKSDLEKAQKVQNNSTVKNNLGVIAYSKGDIKAAEALFADASGDKNATYNAGIIKIKRGDYSGAVSSMGDANTFNAGLAKLLNGSAEAALKTVDASSDKETAAGYYLKAVAGARSGNVSVMVNNLKSAVAKDASLKDKAKKDMEFAKFKDNAEFSSVIN